MSLDYWGFYLETPNNQHRTPNIQCGRAEAGAGRGQTENVPGVPAKGWRVNRAQVWP